VQDRHDRLEQQIKGFRPEEDQTAEDWIAKHKKDFVFLPDQQKRYNVRS